MRIVVGYDGSENAQRALDRACELAANGGSLVVVTAARRSAIVRDPALATSSVDPAESESVRETLDAARALLEGKGIDARTVEARGDAADALVNQAKDENADLVVVGTRGLGAIRRAVLGSVSTKVVHDAPCDVLVVR